LNATFGALFLTEQIESNMAQHCEILGGIPFSHTTVVFSESNIQDPVNSVLDFPMGSNSLSKLIGFTW